MAGDAEAPRRPRCRRASAQVLEHVRALEKELAALKGKLASAQGDELLAQAVDVKGLKVLAAALDGADAKTLRDTMDKLKDKLKTAAIVLAAVDGGKVQIAAGVTADSIGRVKAGELVNFVAQQVGGKGGGKADMAMAGGTDPSRLGAALASVPAWVEERRLMDMLFLEGLEVPCRVGCSDPERATPQSLRVEVQALLPVVCATPALADDLERTVDYRLAGELIDAVQGREYLLIERVAESWPRSS